LCEISIKSWKKTNILRDHLRGVEGVSLSQTGLIRTSLFVPDTRRIDDVLLDMQKKRLHMAIVNDEYGGVSGIVTLEDVIESLVGEIQDEFEVPYTEIQKQADDTYMVDGLTSVENIKGRFNLSIAGEGYSTIGGLVLGLLGHDPTVGEKLNIGNLEMEIKELESKRIKSLLIRKNIPAASSK
jgi:magnesium and cobalt transporter